MAAGKRWKICHLIASTVMEEPPLKLYITPRHPANKSDEAIA
jgi:hypothetical protein